MFSPRVFATLALLPLPLAAQPAHQGNGIGTAYLDCSMATIGGTLDIAFGSPNNPNGLTALCSADSFGPVNFPTPGVGQVWLDFASPSFFYEFVITDAQGDASRSYQLPPTATLVGNPPLFACAVSCEANGWSITKTVRIQYENAGGFRPMGSLAAGRASATATFLGADGRDNETRVLVTGGGGGSILQPLASDSTEIYEPLTQTFSAGPTMAVERTLHRAVRLDDGTVLLIGGTDSNGVVTTSCERFDPQTATLSATGSLNSPRAGHAATLLADGRVLVTGGLADYVDPLNNLLVALNTAQDSGELYDPTTGTWTTVANTMSVPHSGHTQTLLPNGQVLIAAGIRGAVLATFTQIPTPVYTGACSLFDPATGMFQTTGSLTIPRGFHGASVLQNGDVLITGGSVSNTLLGLVNATADCERFGGATWSATAALPTAVTNHTQVAADDGDALVFGGLTGAFPNLTPVDLSGRHDGAAFAAGAAVGTNPGLPGNPAQPVAAGAITRLGDGNWLLVGGSDGALPLTSVFTFHE